MNFANSKQKRFLKNVKLLYKHTVKLVPSETIVDDATLHYPSRRRACLAAGRGDMSSRAAAWSRDSLTIAAWYLGTRSYDFSYHLRFGKF